MSKESQGHLVIQSSWESFEIYSTAYLAVVHNKHQTTIRTNAAYRRDEASDIAWKLALVADRQTRDSADECPAGATR